MPGDRVNLIKGKYIDKKLAKAEDPLQGPYTVERRLPRDRYLLTDIHTRRMHNVVHVSRLQMYPNRQAALPARDSELYPVAGIVGRRIVTSTDRDAGVVAGTPRLEYQIKWVGFGQQQKSWRSIEYLTNIYEMVSAYNRQQEEKGNPLPAEYQPLLPPLLRSPDELQSPGPEDRARRMPHFRPQFYPAPQNVSVDQPFDAEDVSDLEYLSLPRVEPPLVEVSLKVSAAADVTLHLSLNLPSGASETPASQEQPLSKPPSVPRSVAALDRHRSDRQPPVDTAPPLSPSALQSERIRRRQARINRQLGVDMVATLVAP